MMYRYRLSDQNTIERRAVNGLILFKDNWTIQKEKNAKLKAFIDMGMVIEETFDEMKEFSERVERNRKEQEEKIKQEKREQEEIKEKIKIEKSKEKEYIINKAGDSIDLSSIQILNKYEKEESREKYQKLSKQELLNIVLALDTKNFSKEDFKGRSKEDILLTIYQLKNI